MIHRLNGRSLGTLLVLSLVTLLLAAACQGTTGSQGSAGPKGDPGLPGLAGAAGNPGTPGEPGNTGPQGLAGPVGSQGSAGSPATATIASITLDPFKVELVSKEPVIACGGGHGQPECDAHGNPPPPPPCGGGHGQPPCPVFGIGSEEFQILGSGFAPGGGYVVKVVWAGGEFFLKQIDDSKLVINGNGAFSSRWEWGAPSETAEELEGGIYTVVVIDDGGSMATAPLTTVEQKAEPECGGHGQPECDAHGNPIPPPHGG